MLGMARFNSLVLGCARAAVATALVLSSSGARADDATVSVGDPNAGRTTRFADPPPRAVAPIASDEPRDDPPDYYPDNPPPRRELYRAPFRLNLGPAAVTSGRGLGMGLGIAADFGNGTVGARLAANWLRGEARADDPARPLGDGLAQYTGELTLDFNKRGPVHPVFGMGFGLAHVSKPGGGGNAGIGTARIGVEYALGLEDADVRIGGGVTGVMAGPSEREADNLRGYAIVSATLGIGF
jgi:hypothetical protein